MSTLIWIVSVLVAGSLARLVTRSKSRGFVADAALGAVGTVAGAWLLRWGYGGVAPGIAAHGATAFTGAVVLIVLGRLARDLSERAGQVPRKVVFEFEDRLRKLTGSERAALEKVLGPRLVDPNASFRKELTLGEKIADRVATFGGSWTFLGFFAAFMLGWMFINTESKSPSDPYPFILLNLVLSMLAAFQAPVILMSQSRQAAKDRLDAAHDYEVNLKAEIEIRTLHDKLDELRQHDWNLLLTIQQEQIDLLRRLAGVGGGARGEREVAW
jgi:uncharacterized membrane protein/uncharacterized membrane protein YeaQ/YmgE (transglycosylase-associated protein family)